LSLVVHVHILLHLGLRIGQLSHFVPPVHYFISAQTLTLASALHFTRTGSVYVFALDVLLQVVVNI